jgi:hypothetical protein
MSRLEIGAKQCPMPSGDEDLNELLFPFGSADEDQVAIGLDPLLRVRVELTVQKAGVVTSALHEMEVGAVMGIRGPLEELLADRLLGREEYRDRGRRV